VTARAIDLAARIDALLPQTQCGQCGYPGCRPYAEAVATGAADIDRCPPGGDHALRGLARLLGRDMDEQAAPAPHADGLVAVVDENECIGCLKCVRACPVDAILGAAGRMHTVISRFCTGCGLCVAPCPVDCIDLRPANAAPGVRGWTWPRPVAPG
jgi:electron transport complex protein RnfB